MGKKANERRKKIMEEVLGKDYDKKPKRQARTRRAVVKKEGPICCMDKYETLPLSFRRCHGCPKEL